MRQRAQSEAQSTDQGSRRRNADGESGFRPDSDSCVTLEVSARLRVSAAVWRPGSYGEFLKLLTETLPADSKLTDFKIEEVHKPDLVRCPVCGWIHDSAFTRIRLDGSEVFTLRGVLCRIVAVVHRAHEQGFPSLSSKSAELKELCDGYRHPCKAFDDLKCRRAYKLLFDTSRRGSIALRSAVGTNRNKSESPPERQNPISS